MKFALVLTVVAVWDKNLLKHTVFLTFCVCRPPELRQNYLSFQILGMEKTKN